MRSDIFVINQLEDCNCELTLKNKDGSALNLSPVAIKTYALIKDGYGNIIVKFARTASAGWLAMDNTLLNLGTFKFKILSNVTKTLKPGIYYVELGARVPSAGATDDTYDDIVEEYELFQCLASKLSGLTLP